MLFARVTCLIASLWLLAGCAGPAEPKWASDADVARARYVHDAPPSITLITVISNSTGSGAHSALLINADERIIFDPAGTWYHPHLPERNDVHYGMSDPVFDFYIDYHTRVTYHTIVQTVQVSPEVARQAKILAQAYGAVPKAQCAISVGRILDGVPGFEDAPNGYSPKALTKYFDGLPGVTRREFRDFDSDDNSGVIAAPPVLLAAN
jgi:hypothetical protein